MIYCVEDEKNIRELIVYTLVSSGYEACGCEDAKAFYAAVSPDEAELFLLDIMLPGEDGLSILRHVKADPHLKNVPAIMLTAKDSEYDKVTGLDLGADDYISKPFGMMEFLARVRAVLRRSRQQREANAEGGPAKNAQSTDAQNKNAQNKDVLTYKGIELRRAQHQVLSDGVPVELTLKEFNLLEYLMMNEGIVLTRDQLLTNVWGYDFSGESRTVDVHVRTLRQKLGAGGECVETVRGVGYRMGDGTQ